MVDGMKGKEIKLSLFDEVSRDFSYRRGYSTSSFDDINLSPDAPAAEARKALDSWFARIPTTKQADIRGRFRRDDRQHSGALLELVVHELLLRLCNWVRIDPNVDRTTPDFLASYGGTEFFVECTVAQGSDKEFGALRRERDVLDIVEQVNAGPYALFLERQRTGASSVSRRGLTAFLEKRLSSLAALPGLDQIGTILPDVIVWEQEDWLLHFRPIVVGNNPQNQTLAGKHKGPYFVEEAKSIERSLEKKAEKYPHLNRPYVIVVTQREGTANEDDLFESLLGPEEWGVLMGLGEPEVIPSRALNGFFGSLDRLKNRHVSAVLFKRNLGSAWHIQNQWTEFDSQTLVPIKRPDWTLVHHPKAAYPLPIGMFPFATEYIWESGWTKAIVAKSTVNEVLGLPDRWPE